MDRGETPTGRGRGDVPARPRASRRGRARTYVVGRVDEFPEGRGMIADLDGLSVGVFRVDGAFYAVLNRCPHRGAPLGKGALVARVDAPKPAEGYACSPEVPLLECPWHGWEFDLRTGQSYFDPAGVRVRAYPVKVQSGEAVTADVSSGDARRATGLAEGPFVATTFPVSVENDWVCVSLRSR